MTVVALHVLIDQYRQPDNTRCYSVHDSTVRHSIHEYMSYANEPRYINRTRPVLSWWGVTLAQLVKASVGQSDVRGFEPHLGHNLLSCGVFLLKKSRHFGLPLAQTIMAKLAISLSGWLGRYTNVEYLQSLYLKRRGQLLFQV